MNEESIKLKEQPIKNEMEKIQNANEKTFNWTEFLACVSVASTNLHTGFALGFSAIILSQLNDTKEFGDLSTFSLESWIASSISIAAPFGCLFIAFSLDRIGRITTFKAALWPCCIGWLLIALASSPSIVILGRLFTGFAMTVGTNSANVYMAEICNPKLRGSMMSIGSIMLSFGMLVIYTTGLFLPWRIVAWIAFVGAILSVFTTSFWAPESPLWLIYKGKDTKALKSLAYFSQNPKYGRDVKVSFDEMKNIKEKKDSLVNKDIENSNVFRRIFSHLSKPTGYKPVIFMIILFVLQQFTGIYTFQFNAVTMLREVAKGIDDKLATFLFGFFRFILSFVATGMLRTYGRRPLCIISGIIMGITLFISGLCVYLRNIGFDHYTTSWISLVCILIYISAGSVGLMIIPWILPSELFPTEAKGLLVGLIMGWSNTVMFVAVHFYGNILQLLGGMLGILWFFSFISILTVIFVWIFLPETHSMKLSEIQDYFKGNTIYLLRKQKTPQNPLLLN